MTSQRLQAGRLSGLDYLVRPPAFPSAGRAPVLCFLHGRDEGAPTEPGDGVTRHGPLRPGASLRACDFLVVAPQLPVCGDHWHRHAHSVRDIVEAVREAHGGDARRTYLTGFSYGGNGALDLGAAHRGFWAALWAVDPTRVPSPPPELPLWLSIGEAARREADRFVQALRLEPWSVAPVAPRVHLDEGLGHVATATSAYRDGRVYDWLLRWRTGAGAGQAPLSG